MIFHEMLSVAKKNLNRFRFDTIHILNFLSKAAQIAQQQPMPSFARSSWNIVSESEKPLIFLLRRGFRPCSKLPAVDFSGNNYPACSAQSEKSCQSCAFLVKSERQPTLGATDCTGPKWHNADWFQLRRERMSRMQRGHVCHNVNRHSKPCLLRVSSIRQQLPHALCFLGRNCSSSPDHRNFLRFSKPYFRNQLCRSLS